MNFVFIAVGKMIPLGRTLTYSLKLQHPNANIIQISDKNDPVIKDINHKIDFNFYKNSFMINKLESIFLAFKKFGPIIFLDVDMFVLKDLSDIWKILLSSDVLLTEHKKNFPLRGRIHGQDYKELENKMLLDVMPYNAGLIGINNTEFIEMIITDTKNLEKKYHFWYGDQISIKNIINKNIFNLNILDANIYNYAPQNEDDFSDKISILHFRGRKKKLMLTMLPKIYGKKILHEIYK